MYTIQTQENVLLSESLHLLNLATKIIHQRNVKECIEAIYQVNKLDLYHVHNI